ncbi:MAG: (2Fe-2S)-binding protein [Planctomycetaceae bacterium]
MASVIQSGQLVVCHCLQISEDEVRDAIAIAGCCTLPQVRRCTGAGSGCTACHRRIVELLCEENLDAADACGLREFAGAERHSGEPSPICD